MFEEEIMTNEEINQSYVAITSRAKGPPSITVKVVHRSADIAAVEATRLFDQLTLRYKHIHDAQQAEVRDDAVEVVDGGTVEKGEVS